MRLCVSKRMSTIKIINLKKVIPTAIFNTCLIDGQSKKDILNEYPKRSDGAYYLDKFNAHLRNAHGISIKEYVKAHLNEKWPHCPTSDEEVGFTLRGVGMIFPNSKKEGLLKNTVRHLKKLAKKCRKKGWVIKTRCMEKKLGTLDSLRKLTKE